VEYDSIIKKERYEKYICCELIQFKNLSILPNHYIKNSIIKKGLLILKKINFVFEKNTNIIF
jgi:hypothetical protein